MSNRITLGRRLLGRGLGGLFIILVLAAGLMISGVPSATADLAYGPYTCKQGYVWREAVAGDLVCVTYGTRSDTATENALGPSRVEPGGGPWGPDTCKVGFVWRETRPSDHICVPYASRDRASNDNYWAPFTLWAPDATPANGVGVYEYKSGFPDGPFRAQSYVQGTFAPKHRVQIYAYDPHREHGDRGLTLLADIPADWNGILSGADATGWTLFRDHLCMHVGSNFTFIYTPVIIVDQGAGIVSSGRSYELTAPWC